MVLQDGFGGRGRCHLDDVIEFGTAQRERPRGRDETGVVPQVDAFEDQGELGAVHVVKSARQDLDPAAVLRVGNLDGPACQRTDDACLPMSRFAATEDGLLFVAEKGIAWVVLEGQNLFIDEGLDGGVVAGATPFPSSVKSPKSAKVVVSRLRVRTPPRSANSSSSHRPRSRPPSRRH